MLPTEQRQGRPAWAGAIVIAVAAAALLVPASAGATIDLVSAPAVRIHGGFANGRAGTSLADVGDVNGDGHDDFAVGAPDVSPGGRSDAGAVYVIYGGPGLGSVDLANLGSAGLEVDGAAAGDKAGTSVGGAGDVNGDGIDDLIVGAPDAENNSRTDAGSAYVIYGEKTADPTDIDLAGITTSQADRGARIDGAAANDEGGSSVAGAGDVNGDGIDDVIIGVPGAGDNSRSGSGSAYVIYGKKAADPADVDLANITSSQEGRGMRIDGATAGEQAGYSVAGAGDVNGDGVDDLVVGAPLADDNSRSDSGSAYVIYGEKAADPADIDLATITSSQAARGMRIGGAFTGSVAGRSVSAAGDFNGDGVDDLLVGAPDFPASHGSESYVIYGEKEADPPDVDLAKITADQASRAMVIEGGTSSDFTGWSVARAGDINGDGLDDVIFGAIGTNNNSRNSSGSAYVIYGEKTADPADIDVANITTSQADRGVRIDGAVAGDEAGTAVGGAGDFNGDGHPDVLVGSPDATTPPPDQFHTARSQAGTAYVLDFGPPVTKIRGSSDTNDTTPTFTFTSSETASFECSIDTGTAAFGPCSGPGQADTPAMALADGTYTFRLRATDSSANTGTETKSFTVDTKAPQTKLTKHPKKTLHLKRHKKTAKAKFAFSSSEQGSSFRCSLDGARAKRCKSPDTLKLKAGKHTFSVTATDAAGNPDPSPARFKVKVKAARRPS